MVFRYFSFCFLVLFGLEFFFFLFYVGFLVFLFVREFKVAGRSIELMRVCAGSKKRISRELSKFDPTFNYEYFESKALALVRLKIFSDVMFDSIVDVWYRGGFRFNGCSVSDGLICLDLDLFVVLTVDEDGCVSDRDGVVHLSMCHDSHFPVDECFNMSRVLCEHCGGSFDAYRHSECPCCGQKYMVENKDWKILSFSISK